MRKTGFFLVMLATALTACGGGDSADDAFKPADPPAPPGAAITSISVTTSAPTIPSDGSAPAEIRAYARNANNQFVSGVPISFSATSGGLNVTSATTDATGLASATLTTAGDPARRTITVTAASGTISSTVSVLVNNSALSVQGPLALNQGQTGPFTITLLDSGGKPIVGRAVNIASSRSNVLSATSVTTDATGKATFNLTISASGNDTITVSGAGLTATQVVTVSSDAFQFTSPGANSEITLATPRDVQVSWRVNGVAQVGQPVTFTTTRGSVTPVNGGVTDGAGVATATVQATNAGGAVITATAGSSSAQLPLEFVATVPSSIDVQPSSFSIATGQTSTLTAVVRDPTGNLVKNRRVDFTLSDVTGGTLSLGAAVTDSQGRAQTVYTASSVASANEGVEIKATVQGTQISKSVKLTVARRELFISLGTGNTILEPNDAQYSIVYAVQVTDANGSGVPNVPLSMRILSKHYYKGVRAPAVSPATGWGTAYSIPPTPGPQWCADEDTNRNGVLDNEDINGNGVLDAGEDRNGNGVLDTEDFNGSGRLEAGNIASVSPASATTNADGVVLVTITYPQEYAFYLDVELSASTTVQGTEYVRSSNFMLAGSAADFNSTDNAPPGPVSPFGRASSCSIPD